MKKLVVVVIIFLSIIAEAHAEELAVVVSKAHDEGQNVPVKHVNELVAPIKSSAHEMKTPSQSQSDLLPQAQNSEEVSAASVVKARKPIKKMYLKAEGGLSFPMKLSGIDYERKKPKEAGVFGVGAGVNFNERLSLDATFYHFMDHKYKGFAEERNIKQSIKSNVLMLGINFNIVDFNYITSFISAGGGVAYNEVGDYVTTSSDPVKNNKHFGKTKQNLVWNIGGGLKSKVAEDWDVVVSYKFFDLGKIETSTVGIAYDNNSQKLTSELGAIKSRLRTHAIMGGIMYNF